MAEIDPAKARRATDAVPSIPCDAEGPVFREPWEAQAFAMALALYDRGLFAWPEWAAILGDEIKKAQAAGDPDTGETYYQHWLNALERMVADGFVRPEQQDILRFDDDVERLNEILTRFRARSGDFEADGA